MKCDEAKPSCLRCQSARKQCGGYEHFASGEQKSLAWYRPQQLASRDQREGRAFQFFAVNVGPVLSGVRHTDFWTHLVMQFGHFSPAIRHAVLSISSLYEDFQYGRRPSSQLPSSPFAIKHYAASISHIRTAQDENLTLLACVLYLCIEYLLGDIDAAIQHCRHGITILNSGNCSIWVLQHIMPIFRRISSLPFFSEVPCINIATKAEVCVANDNNSAPFVSVAEAEDNLEWIEVQARHLRPFHNYLPPFEKEAMRASCISLLKEWEIRAASLESSQTSLPTQSLISLRRFMAMKEVLRIRMFCFVEGLETKFDNHLDSFQTIVRLAEDAVGLRAKFSPSSAPQPAFTFEEGFLPPLMFVANKCRDFATRLKALKLMSTIPAPKEGPIDVGTLYRAAQRAIEIEHDVSLDDSRHWVPKSELSYPFAANRVVCIPIRDQFETYINPDGSKSSRVALRVISHSAAGKRASRIEYLSDEPPKHCPHLPSLRCSRPRVCAGS